MDDNGPEASAEPPTPPTPDKLPSSQWDTDEALEFLTMERSVHGGEDAMTNVELTRKLIEQAAPMAAMSMIHLSRHAQNENTKMNASKWVCEFATQIETEDGRAAWEKMLPDVVSEAEKITAGAIKSGEAPPTASPTFEIGD